jgi:hypothetical protein
VEVSGASWIAGAEFLCRCLCKGLRKIDFLWSGYKMRRIDDIRQQCFVQQSLANGVLAHKGMLKSYACDVFWDPAMAPSYVIWICHVALVLTHLVVKMRRDGSILYRILCEKLMGCFLGN